MGKPTEFIATFWARVTLMNENNWTYCWILREKANETERENYASELAATTYCLHPQSETICFTLHQG